MKLAELSDIGVSSMPTPPAPEAGIGLLPPCPLKEEECFYGEYAWCLNPCLTVRDAGHYLAGELARFDNSLAPWKLHEVGDQCVFVGLGIAQHGG